MVRATSSSDTPCPRRRRRLRARADLSRPRRLRRGVASARRRAAWFDNYATRIVTRDASDITKLRHLGDLPTLLRLLAAHTASSVAKANLSRESGIPETTLPPYLDLLETLYLVQRVPAWSNNLAGRVARAAKLSLLDSGLAARMLNVSAASLAADMHPDPAGRLVETFVLAELRKQIPYSDTKPMLLRRWAVAENLRERRR